MSHNSLAAQETVNGDEEREPNPTNVYCGEVDDSLRVSTRRSEKEPRYEDEAYGEEDMHSKDSSSTYLHKKHTGSNTSQPASVWDIDIKMIERVSHHYMWIHLRTTTSLTES